MRTHAVCRCLALVILFLGCAGERVSAPDPFKVRQIPADVAGDVGAVAEGNTAFALDLYRAVAGEENLFLSPYSISTALAMTWAGARGVTETEMASALHFPLDQERLHPAFGAVQKSLETGAGLGGYKLSIANRLWGAKGYPWLPDFLAVTRETYGAELQPLDFLSDPESCRTVINDWVETKTAGRIQDLLQQGSIHSSTRLVLTNAIYFKGRWASRFDPADTRDGTFRNPARVVSVPMMRQDSKFLFASYDSLKILRMPYVGGDLCMVLLLPARVDGLSSLEAQLTPARLSDWLGALHEAEVDVTLPRFSFTSSFDLGATLAGLGMPSAFDEGAANFSGMDGVQDLYITKVVHKAFVLVNEEGTEAAAATGVVIGPTSAGLSFDADHPFLFLIRDEVTGSVLFLGKVVDPSL